jgi:predicted transcriptional regulator
MPSVREELESFHQYAAERLSVCELEPSLEELLVEWTNRGDREQINAAIREGLADIAAGRFEPAHAAMEKIRLEFGIPNE